VKKKSEYPEDWDLIAFRIKEAAGQKCENCGRFSSKADGYVLTVHHIDGNKGNCEDENLVALCQRCHLSWERVKILGQLWLFEKPDWIKRRGL